MGIPGMGRRCWPCGRAQGLEEAKLNLNVFSLFVSCCFHNFRLFVRHGKYVWFGVLSVLYLGAGRRDSWPPDWAMPIIPMWGHSSHGGCPCFACPSHGRQCWVVGLGLPGATSGTDPVGWDLAWLGVW